MLAVCCLLLSALCLRAELAFKWTVEVSQPLPYAAEALQGESFNLEAKVVQYRVPMLEAAEATFYYQTPEMEASQWYTVPAVWDATTATASVAFTPAMDVGSTKYRFFFGIETEQGKNYRVFGTLRLKASPGFSPATLTPTDVRAEIIQEILKAVFEESDERYATKAEHAALAVQVQGKADASHTHAIAQVSNLQAQLDAKAATSTVSALTTRLTAAEAAIEEVADAKQDKLTVDSTLSASSTNPIQNQAVKAALDKKAEKSHTHTISQVSGLQTQLNNMTDTLNNKASKSEFNSDNYATPYVRAYGSSMHSLRTVFNANNEADNWAEKFDNAKLTFEWWHQYNNVKEDSFDVPMTAFRALAAGGSTKGLETWADDGTAGIDPSKTFVGVDASHVFHANGQIHGAQMLSADTNKRLYVPFDLMQNDEERWLSAASVWNGNRNIIFNGDTTTLVQPLVPTNKGDNAAYVPYALPCFENSPIFWKGQIIWHDGTTTLSKSVSIPWSRVTGTTASPSELALKSDLETLKSEPAPPTLEVATWSGSVCSVPWGTNPLLIDCTDLEVVDVVFSFPIDSWPEGAQRTLILRTGAMADATGTGTLLHAFTQQDATLLTAKIHGYEVFPTGEEIICSAMRLGNTIHLTTTMRSSL